MIKNERCGPGHTVIGRGHPPAKLVFQYLYFSGITLWTFRTLGRVILMMGSTAILSLFLTHSRVRSFLSSFLVLRSALSCNVRSRTRLLNSPSRSINQLDQLHLMLFPKWTTSGRGTTRSN